MKKYNLILLALIVLSCGYNTDYQMNGIDNALNNNIYPEGVKVLDMMPMKTNDTYTLVFFFQNGCEDINNIFTAKVGVWVTTKYKWHNTFEYLDYYDIGLPKCKNGTAYYEGLPYPKYDNSLIQLTINSKDNVTTEKFSNKWEVLK